MLHGQITKKEDHGREASTHRSGNSTMEQATFHKVCIILVIYRMVYRMVYCITFFSDSCIGLKITWKKGPSRAAMPTPIQWRSL